MLGTIFEDSFLRRMNLKKTKIVGHCVALNDAGDEVFIPFVTVAISGIGSIPAVMKMFYRDLWPSFDCQATETMFPWE